MRLEQVRVMREVIGNIWEVEADAVCIPTQGRTNTYGELIMGAGLALDAKKRFPRLALDAGRLVDLYGNIPFHFTYEKEGKKWNILTFPTKKVWAEDASLSLIARGAAGVRAIADKNGWTNVAVPRIGAGLGNLLWADVLTTIEPILDERFFIVSLPPRG